MEVLFIMIWLVLSGVCAAVASGRGRSGLNWFLLSLLIGPVIALVIVCVIQPLGDGNGAAYAPRSETDDRNAGSANRMYRGLGY